MSWMPLDSSPRCFLPSANKRISEEAMDSMGRKQMQRKSDVHGPAACASVGLRRPWNESYIPRISLWDSLRRPSVNLLLRKLRPRRGYRRGTEGIQHWASLLAWKACLLCSQMIICSLSACLTRSSAVFPQNIQPTEQGVQFHEFWRGGGCTRRVSEAEEVNVEGLVFFEQIANHRPGPRTAPVGTSCSRPHTEEHDNAIA
eukprot:2013678-Rhodomonas_salina.4